ncbi:MAG: DUF882 domain-containing protein [Myxococcota bacterium]|nr:DUF882 domain-containing protein [Myxococcota bacterium]
MQLSARRRAPEGARKSSRRGGLWFSATLCLWVARDAPAHALAEGRGAADTPLAAKERAPRFDSWAQELAPIGVASLRTRSGARLRLYGERGEVDDEARTEFEQIANEGGHELAPRLQQLVVKAAYHFRGARVLIVSAWRENAGRHTAGEAIDFKLEGVRTSQLASYLRSLPRVGVGVYTHPRTQFVHLDVREPSYHWADSSPPGARGREWPLPDQGMKRRDAAYEPAMDLPL